MFLFPVTLCICLSVCLILSSCNVGTVVLKEITPVPTGVYDINISSDTLPAELVGTWQRLSDSIDVRILDSAALRLQKPGAYRCDDKTICLRTANTAAAYAESLCGIPSSGQRALPEMAHAAWQRRALNPVTMMTLSWRLADDWPWPWVDGVSLYGGLSGLCQHYNAKGQGYTFDSTQGVYVDDFGHAISLNVKLDEIPEAQRAIPQVLVERSATMRVHVQYGDIIAGEDSTGSARFGIVVADRGRIGFLDPEDSIVSAFVPPTQQATHIESWRLGFLIGDSALHVYRRDKKRGTSIRSHYKPDNPIWGLSLRRQLMALAGMVILILVLFRRARIMRRR